MHFNIVKAIKHSFTKLRSKLKGRKSVVKVASQEDFNVIVGQVAHSAPSQLVVSKQVASQDTQPSQLVVSQDTQDASQDVVNEQITSQQAACQASQDSLGLATVCPEKSVGGFEYTHEPPDDHVSLQSWGLDSLFAEGGEFVSAEWVAETFTEQSWGLDSLFAEVEVVEVGEPWGLELMFAEAPFEEPWGLELLFVEEFSWDLHLLFVEPVSVVSNAKRMASYWDHRTKYL